MGIATGAGTCRTTRPPLLVGCVSKTKAKAINPVRMIAKAVVIDHGLICRIATVDNGTPWPRQCDLRTRDTTSEATLEHVPGNDGDQHGRARGNEHKIEPSRHNGQTIRQMQSIIWRMQMLARYPKELPRHVRDGVAPSQGCRRAQKREGFCHP